MSVTSKGRVRLERETELLTTAKTLIDLLAENFPVHKYQENFSLWGLAMKGSIFDLQEYPEFVPALLKAISHEEKLKEPEYNVPKRSDPFTYYAMYCLCNQAQIERFLERKLQRDYEPARDILNERSLLEEAAQLYLQHPGRDLTEFLLYFDVSRLRFGEDYGSYTPMLKRLLFRFGEHQLDLQMFGLLPDKLAETVKTEHERALYGRSQEVEAPLRRLYDEKVGNGLSNGHSAPEPARVDSIFLPGRKRILSPGNGVGIDWSEFLESRQQRIQITRSFNKSELMRNAVRQRLINEYLLQYQENSELTLQRLEEEYQRKEGVEKEIYGEVLDIYQGMKMIGDSPTIAHSMTRR
jgi:hypothetical protein